MAATVMPKQSRKPRKKSDNNSGTDQRENSGSLNLDPAVQKIIDQGRANPVKAPAKGAWTLGAVTTVLLWASFTPLNWGPLGWIALVPVLVLCRLQQRTRAMYVASYVMGFAWAIATLQWMRLGHWTMAFALIALSFYVAFYFPVFLAITRSAVHRLKVPLAVAAPVAWVGLEFLRAHLFTGFSWYYLGHTQWAWPEMIQISDVTGAYGISFVMVMVSATIAMLLPNSIFQRLNLLPPEAKSGSADSEQGDSQQNNSNQNKPASSTAGYIQSRRPWVLATCSLLVFAAVLSYGFVRRSQADFQPGPQVALIQGNISPEVKHDRDMESIRETLRLHDQMTGAAVKQQPDLIVWPETMFPFAMESAERLSDDQLRAALTSQPNADMLFKQWRSNEVRERIVDDARKANAALMVGVVTKSLGTDGITWYNSSIFATPDLGYEGRYDKLHPLIFGEYTPLKETLPILTAFSPTGGKVELAKGDAAKIFSYKNWNFAPIICFEDTVPHLVRSIAEVSTRIGKPVDCFVNQTNDGWFRGSSELDQHLITAAFRCVETRTPMVRCVNTGISAFIDGDGIIRDPDYFYDFDNKTEVSNRTESGAWKRQMNAVVVSNVPLDSRTSLYTKHGDWFATVCCSLAVFAMFVGLLPRRTAVVAG